VLPSSRGSSKLFLNVFIKFFRCHFDHIIAYSKGGKSVLENCQVLCSDCNLSKSDKELHDFLLEEKAKKFMADESIFEKRDFSEEKVNEDNTKITKEKFDKLISDFISINGDIKKIDFTRERNGLPSITYVHKYYGNITNLKQSFGLRINREWNRESI